VGKANDKRNRIYLLDVKPTVLCSRTYWYSIWTGIDGNLGIVVFKEPLLENFL
jgi:hypothetical protein